MPFIVITLLLLEGSYIMVLIGGAAVFIASYFLPVPLFLFDVIALLGRFYFFTLLALYVSLAGFAVGYLYTRKANVTRWFRILYRVSSVTAAISLGVLLLYRTLLPI